MVVPDSGVTGRRLGSGLLVYSAAPHTGVARGRVHRLKYQGMAAAATGLAAPMARLIDSRVAVLVPVPRALGRMWRYGVDPAAELTRALSRLTGVPMVSALHRPLWWPRRAGPAGRLRGIPRFKARQRVHDAVLVDDVVTTGLTLAAAHRALPGVVYAVTATTALPGLSRRRSV